MATSTKTKEELLREEMLANLKADHPETAKIKLFKDTGRYKNDVFVGVNGRRFQIQRGVEVEVPWEIAEVLKQSNQQDEVTAQRIDRYVSESRFADTK